MTQKVQSTHLGNPRQHINSRIKHPSDLYFILDAAFGKSSLLASCLLFLSGVVQNIAYFSKPKFSWKDFKYASEIKILRFRFCLELKL